MHSPTPTHSTPTPLEGADLSGLNAAVAAAHARLQPRTVTSDTCTFQENTDYDQGTVWTHPDAKDQVGQGEAAFGGWSFSKRSWFCLVLWFAGFVPCFSHSLSPLLSHTTRLFLPIFNALLCLPSHSNWYLVRALPLLAIVVPLLGFLTHSIPLFCATHRRYLPIVCPRLCTPSHSTPFACISLLFP